jgi:hypothetical protein
MPLSVTAGKSWDWIFDGDVRGMICKAARSAERETV